MNKRRAVITGMGVLSNNGKGVNEFWEHCTRGISGIKECSLFDVSNLRTSKVGEISADIPYLVDSPSELGRIQFIIKEAIDEMFADSKLTVSDICVAGNRAFLSFATSLAATQQCRHVLLVQHLPA